MALTAIQPENDRQGEDGAIFRYFERTFSFPKSNPTAGTLQADMPKIGDYMPGTTASGLLAPRVVKAPTVQSETTNVCHVRVTYRAYRART